MTKRTNEGTWATVNRYLSSCVSSLAIGLADLILFLHAHRDSFTSVQNCSVIPAAEGFSNLLEGGLCVAPSQIHRHLAREYNIRGASFAGHIRESNFKMFGHLLLNLIDGNRLPGFFPQNIPKKLFYRFAGNSLGHSATGKRQPASRRPPDAERWFGHAAREK